MLKNLKLKSNLLNGTGYVVAVKGKKNGAARVVFNRDLFNSLPDNMSDEEAIEKSSATETFPTHIIGNCTAEEACFKVVCHTLNEIADDYENGDFKGIVSLVLPHNVHIRMNGIRGFIKDSLLKGKNTSDENFGADCAEHLAKKVAHAYEMTDSLKDIIAKTADIYQYFATADGLGIDNTSAFNLNHWIITKGTVAEGDVLDFKAGKAGNVEVEVNTLTGQYVVEAPTVINNKVVYTVARRMNEDSEAGGQWLLAKDCYAGACANLPKARRTKGLVAKVKAVEGSLTTDTDTDDAAC